MPFLAFDAMAPEKLPVGFAISGIDPSPCAHRFGVRTACASSHLFLLLAPVLPILSLCATGDDFMLLLQLLAYLGNDLIFSPVLTH